MAERYLLKYQLTPSAYQDAIRLHQATALARLRVMMILGVVIGLVLVFTVDRTVGLVVTLVNILLLASTWIQFVDRWLIARTARGVFGATCEFVVDDRGIHYEHPLGNGHLPWSALTLVRANDKSIVFRRDRVMAAYIPTIAFASQAERESFLVFARSRVGGSPQLSDVVG